MNPLSNNRLFTMVSTTQMQRSTTHHSAKKAKTDTKWLLPYTNWSVMLWVGLTLRLHIWNIVILEFARTSTIQLLQQFLYFIFKSSKHPISLSFIRFQCILHHSRVLLSEFWNFYKLRRVDLISGGNQFWRKYELLGPPFCISILKVLSIQFLGHSLDVSVFCMVQKYFSQSHQISTN